MLFVSLRESRTCFYIIVDVPPEHLDEFADHKHLHNTIYFVSEI